MYTPPVPPVAMFSVLPVKSGAALALVAGAVVPLDVARGASQAAAVSSIARATDRMRAPLISTSSPAGRRMLPLAAAFATELRRRHPAPLLDALGDHRWERRRPAVLVDRHEDEIRGRDVDGLSGQQVLGIDPDADL